jgi:hypothetical protein
MNKRQKCFSCNDFLAIQLIYDMLSERAHGWQSLCTHNNQRLLNEMFNSWDGAKTDHRPMGTWKNLCIAKNLIPIFLENHHFNHKSKSQKVNISFHICNNNK